MMDRRRADAKVDLGRARLAQDGHYLPSGGATNDRVVYDDEPFSGHDLAQRAQLDVDSALAHALGRLDEGPAGIAVSNHALAIRQPRAFRVPGGGRRTGVRHRHDDVRLNGRLGGESQAHSTPRLVQVAAHHV